jgi:hypothetical protein
MLGTISRILFAFANIEWIHEYKIKLFPLAVGEISSIFPNVKKWFNEFF